MSFQSRTSDEGLARVAKLLFEMQQEDLRVNRDPIAWDDLAPVRKSTFIARAKLIVAEIENMSEHMFCFNVYEFDFAPRSKAYTEADDLARHSGAMVNVKDDRGLTIYTVWVCNGQLQRHIVGAGS